MNIGGTWILVVAVLTGCGRPPQTSSEPTEKWDDANDPLHLGRGFQFHLAELPPSGSLAQRPWTDTYWPSYQGGIAKRWRTHDNSFTYSPAAQPKDLPSHALARLSPAEKFDLLRGNYHYPLVSSERHRTSEDSPRWEGLCHGWAPAALAYQEPQPVTMTNQDGLEIPFGSSDIKALLTYHQGIATSARARMIGLRCNDDLADVPHAGARPACRDINAGAFHLVLTNYIGLKKQGFIADVTRDAEVWNQPVYGYRSTLLKTTAPSLGAARGTASEAVVHTEMTYVVEVSPSWQPVRVGVFQGTVTKGYDYRLELDRQGRILGGVWLSADRPDFLWIQEKPEFKGEWRLLGDLYRQSIGA